jgi:hypothetical protein
MGLVKLDNWNLDQQKLPIHGLSSTHTWKMHIKRTWNSYLSQGIWNLVDQNFTMFLLTYIDAQNFTNMDENECAHEREKSPTHMGQKCIVSKPDCQNYWSKYLKVGTKFVCVCCGNTWSIVLWS